MNYPGGKNANGTYQVIINQIPPHTRYVELFLGSGAIIRNKILAKDANIGIEIDPKVIQAQWSTPKPEITIISGSAFDWLKKNMYAGKKTFIYADPPYPINCRSGQKAIYDYELTDEQHTALLELLIKIPANIAISTYKNELYTSMLQAAGWRLLEFDAMTLGGHATEQLWCNYPEPTELHDYRFIGKNFTDRQRIHRKINRHINKLIALPILERNAIIDAINGSKYLDNIEETKAEGQNEAVELANKPIIKKGENIASTLQTEEPLFITGYYGCSCHPFKDWDECELFHKRKFTSNEWVKHRCTGKRGVIARKTDKQGFCLVKYGPVPSDIHQQHSAQLEPCDPIEEMDKEKHSGNGTSEPKISIGAKVSKKTTHYVEMNEFYFPPGTNVYIDKSDPIKWFIGLIDSDGGNGSILYDHIATKEKAEKIAEENRFQVHPHEFATKVRDGLAKVYNPVKIPITEAKQQFSNIMEKLEKITRKEPLFKKGDRVLVKGVASLPDWEATIYEDFEFGDYLLKKDNDDRLKGPFHESSLTLLKPVSPPPKNDITKTKPSIMRDIEREKRGIGKRDKYGYPIDTEEKEAFLTGRDFIIHNYPLRTPTVKQIKADQRNCYDETVHINTAGNYLIVQKYNSKKCFFKFLISELHKNAYPPVITNQTQ